MVTADPARAAVYPAFLRTGIAPTTLRAGGESAAANFARGDDELSLWLVRDDDELVETLAALAGSNPMFNADVRCALVPEAVVRAAGRIVHSPENADPNEPEQVAARHHDLHEPNLAALVACFAPDANPPGWAGRMRARPGYADVWQQWSDEVRLPRGYGETIRSHLLRLRKN